jgi:hypothetical protein
MNYDPSLKISHEQISQVFTIFCFYRLRLQVLITTAVEEPIYREYRSLYSRYIGRMFTGSVSHALIT